MGAFSSALGLTIGAVGYRLIVDGDWSFTAGLVVGSWMPLSTFLIGRLWKWRAAE